MARDCKSKGTKRHDGDVSFVARFASKRTLSIILVAAVMISGILIIGGLAYEDSDAAVNDTFTQEGLTYKVKTESGSSNTVSVTAAASDLTTVVIPDTVTYGEPAIEYSVTEIGASVFSGKTTITSLTIGSNVKTIGSNAFENCTGLTTFTIPRSVTSVGSHCFDGTNLTLLTIDTSAIVQNIGGNPEEIVYTDAVTYVGPGVVGANTRAVTIGSNVSNIVNGALTCVTYQNPYRVIPFNITSITNYSPNYELSNGIFYKGSNGNYTQILRILEIQEPVRMTIPDTVTYCDGCQFMNRTIESLDLGGLTSISPGLFQGATFTSDFSLTTNITTTVGTCSFQGATFKEVFTIPSTTGASDCAFKNAVFEKGLIYNGGRGMSPSAFEGATIPSFTFNPSSNITIYSEAFKSATIGSAFTIPSTVTLSLSSGKGLFTGATLAGVTVDMATIPARTFLQANIGTLTLTNNVTSIGDYAFQKAVIGTATIPDTITSFGSYSFDQSTVSSTTENPLVFNGSATIGQYAFQKTKLVSIQIPSMEGSFTIGNYAFYQSNTLGEITFLGTIDASKVGNSAFDTRYSVNATLFSMKVVDSEGHTEAENDGIAALKDASKFGSTPINIPPYSLDPDHDYSGTPDGDIAWSYTYQDRKMVFSVNNATTAMRSYAAGLAPWNSLKPYVTEIIVEDGVTSLSLEGLSDFPNCTKLTIGSSVTTFGGAKNLNKLQELIFKPTNCGSLSGSNLLDNMGADSPNGVKVTFQSLSDGVILRVPQYFLNTPSANVTELVFISAGGLTLQSNSMNSTTHVSKITYDVAGSMTNNSSNLSTYIATNADSLELVIGSRMTALPSSVFTSNRVSSVNILSENITSVGDSAFLNNTNITAISLPASCVSIGANAFKGCTALQSFTIAYDVSKDITIGQSAFEGCVALETFDFRNVTNVGSRAFYGCASLTCDADLSKATNINSQAFSGTSADDAPNLGDVTIATGVWLGEDAFRYSGASFGTVTISPATKWGGSGHYFDGCSVEAFVINYQTTTPSNMLKGVTSSYTVTLKKTPNDFSLSNDKVTSVTVDSTFQWIKVTGNTTSPLNRAFINCSNLTTVDIQKSGIVLGAQAFDGCSKLATVTGFDNITEFQGYTFRDCVLLFRNSGTVEFNGKAIGYRDFENTGITSVRLINCTLQCETAHGIDTSSPFAGCSITTLEYSWTNISTDTTKIWNVMDGNLTDYTLVILGNSIPNVNFSEGYDGGTHLVAVTIGTGVTGSTDAARFTGCTNLVTINYNATDFTMDTFSEASPFAGLSQAMTVNLGNNAKVPNNMFRGVNISNAITIASGMVIGDYAFYGSAVPTVTVNSGSTLGNEVFRACTSLTEVTLDGTATLGTGIFRQCDHLVTAHLTGNMITIPASTFSTCFILSNVNIPSTVTVIDSSAFSNCRALDDIELPSGLTTIGSQAFYDCNSLTSIEIPVSVTSIGSSAFAYCVNLTTLVIGDLDSPTEDQKLAIGPTAFRFTKISNLTIPNRTKTISTGAFAGQESNNTGIRNVTLSIPANVTFIGGAAFERSSSLTTVRINANISTADGAFSGAGSDTGFTVILSSDVTAISEGMFKGSKVSAVQKESGTFTIGQNAFQNCLKMTSVPDNATDIGSDAFSGCTGIVNLVIPSTVTTVELHAFDGCTNITTLRTTGTTYLGRYSLSDCTGLTLAVFSSGTTFYNTGSDVFNGAWNFKKIGGDIVNWDSNFSYLAGRAFIYDTESVQTLKECYTLSFDVGGLADTIVSVPIIGLDGLIDDGDIPTITGLHEGYYWDGYWYKEPQLEHRWNFEEDVVTGETGNVTIYAGIRGQTYHVTINGNGGSKNITFDVVYGVRNDVPDLSSITRAGYDIFWITVGTNPASDPIIRLETEHGITSYLMNGNVTDYTNFEVQWIHAGDATFYVSWTTHRYDGTLSSDDRGTDGSYSVLYLSTTVGVVAPEVTGYNVDGYYTDRDGKGQQIFSYYEDTYHLCPNVFGMTDSDGRWICTDAEPPVLYAKFVPKTTDVTLNKNGGSEDGSATAAYDSDHLVIGTQAVKTGYHVIGYYTDWECTAENQVADMDGMFLNTTVAGFIQNGKWATEESDVTLYVKWAANTYTIAFNANGGEGTMDSIAGVVYDENQAITNTFTRDLYRFAGKWAVGSPSGEQVTSPVRNLTATDGATVTLYALWEPITYTIAFNANGGTGSMEPIVGVEYGADQAITNTFTRDGYEFAGKWAVGSALGEQVTSPVSNLTTTDGATVTLYALWTPRQYTITLIAGEGGTNGTATVVFGEHTMTVQTAPTKNGCEVMLYMATAGSGSVANSSGTLYNYDGYVTNGNWSRASDTDLYVSWIGKQYTVQLIDNYEGGGSTTTTISFGTRVSDIVRPAMPERTGYNFAGYYTIAEGGTAQNMIFDQNCVAQGYKVGWTDDNTWRNYSDEQVLYAYWTPMMIYLYLYGDTLDGTGYYRIAFDSTDVTELSPGPGERSGYEIEGYYTADDYQTKVINADYTVVGGIENHSDANGKWKGASSSYDLYIKWVPTTTSITLNGNGGTANGSATATYDSGVLTNYVAVSRVGYTLLGYYDHDRDQMVIDSDGALCASYWTNDGSTWKKTTATLTLYAHWQIAQFTITFMDGQTEISHITQDYGTTIIPPADPSKVGYQFTGWDRAIPETMPAENITINAQWQAYTYDVVFNANGGDGTMAKQTFTYDVPGNLTLNAFTMTGANFSGWNGLPDGTGSPYTDGQQVLNLAGPGEVILYAQWTAILYTITFDTDGGSAVDPIPGYYNSPIVAPAEPTKEGYAFVKWEPAVPAVMPANNMTIKAIWSVLPSVNDGETIDFVSHEAETVVIDTSVGAIADALADTTKTEVKVEGKDWKMEIPKEIISSAAGSVSIGAKTLSVDEKNSLPAAVKDKVVFSLSLTDNNGAISFTGKKIKVSLPYTLKEGESASDVKVFYLDANNNPVAVDEVTYDSTLKCAVFETDHFSNWYVDVVPDDSPSSGGSNIGLIIGIVIGVIVLAGVGVFVFMKKGKKSA